ncbi:MAG: hypothetical protein MJ158_01120 [Alphaproteobacteria bacterium]|nr:hypothetical protein [Alphaproteobacteria bacterium]
MFTTKDFFKTLKKAIKQSSTIQTPNTATDEVYLLDNNISIHFNVGSYDIIVYENSKEIQKLNCSAKDSINKFNAFSELLNFARNHTKKLLLEQQKEHAKNIFKTIEKHIKDSEKYNRKVINNTEIYELDDNIEIHFLLKPERIISIVKNGRTIDSITCDYEPDDNLHTKYHNLLQFASDYKRKHDKKQKLSSLEHATTLIESKHSTLMSRLFESFNHKRK